MNCRVRIRLAFVLAVLSLAARAAPPVNVCVTPGGGALYGDDTSRKDCGNSAIQRLNPAGPKEDHIPAPLTREQKKEKNAKKERLAACKTLVKNQKQKDDALLDLYPSEDDLQEARYRALGEQLKRVDGANERMKELIAKGRDLTEQGRFFAPPHAMPASLQADREGNSRLERNQTRVIEDAAHEIHHINDLYDADLKRYRDLVNGTAVMPCNEAIR
jgi:hypothetical protein